MNLQNMTFAERFHAQKSRQQTFYGSRKLRRIYNNAPNMIHEKSYKPMKCCLCDAEMKTIHDTHNPFPLAPFTYAKEAFEKQLPHRCCSRCNAEKVMPARLNDMKLYRETCNHYNLKYRSH